MKTKILMAAVFGAMFLTACEPVKPEKTEDNGVLAISIVQSTSTKAVSTQATTAESKLNKMRVLVYDSANELYKDVLLESPFTSQAIPNVKTGNYSVYAMANTCAAVSDVTTSSALTATTVSLSDCGLSESAGFVMFSPKAEVNVLQGSTPTPVSLTVSRFPARVKLVSVKNELPAALGDLKVEQVMLINGYSTWNLSATGSPGTLMNAAGRKNGGTGDIISSASDADFGDYTFMAVPSADQTVTNGGDAKNYGYCFYSMPNTTQNDITGAKVTGGKTRLVVKATYNNKSYYYPVTLKEGIQRNKCYEVTLKISGSGSEDPNNPVEKGSIGATITVSDWGTGLGYLETI